MTLFERALRPAAAVKTCQHVQVSSVVTKRAAWVLACCLVTLPVRVPAQQANPAQQPPTTPKAPAAPQPPLKPMTPEQAKQLFRSVDQILSFVSKDSALPIRHSVKRRLTTRDAVEKYLVQKMNEDKDTKRIERSSIVLKKFGLIDRDFQLQPFLVSLLKEQIAGYYDSKTKTVNLLDWIDPESQKPVLAHELTHALQDQHVDLDKWGDKSADGIAKNVTEDNRHLSTDESDTAREAALEGQAMVTYMDWSLAGTSQTMRTSPDLPEDDGTDAGEGDADSPILAKAPLVLKESLLFPYKDGLRFEQILLKDHGAEAAFTGVLDRPPDTSYEIMNPHAYEQHVHPTLLTLPDLHPLLDKEYAPYDVGIMGALDVRMLGQLFGGAGPAADLAKGWDGGMYYAAQKRDFPNQDSTASIGLLYFSRWRTPADAAEFMRLQAESLKKQYRQLEPVAGADTEHDTGHVLSFKTEEGPIVIERQGRQVLVSEGFGLPLETQLQWLLFSNLQAPAEPLNAPDAAPSKPKATPEHVGQGNIAASHELTGGLVQMLSAYGMPTAAFRKH